MNYYTGNRQAKKGKDTTSNMSNNPVPSLTNGERRELKRLEKVERGHRSMYIGLLILLTIIWILAIVSIVTGKETHIWQGLLWLGSFIMICLIAVHKQLKLYRIIKKLQSNLSDSSQNPSQ